MRLPKTSKAALRRAFSLLEMLVATAVMLLVLSIVFRIIQGTTDTWKNTTGKTEGFRGARTAFEAMTRTLSQATLNTYFDYVDSSGNYRDASNMASFSPVKYARRSDLHFTSGLNMLAGSQVTNPVSHAVFFQAPLGYTRDATYQGMENLVNGTGFYVYYGTDPSQPGFLTGTAVQPKYRFRLMQYMQASEELAVGDPSVTGGTTSWNTRKWFTDSLTAAQPASSQLAENVIALVILPKLSKTDQADPAGGVLTADYSYDSRDRAKPKTLHQLPPVVQVVMVVIDEASAAKLGNSTTPPNLGLTALFKDSAVLANDLQTLSKNLSAIPGNAAGNAIPLRYEIFQSEVAIRGAKWSKN